MQVDKTTLADLSIISIDEEQSVFHKLNYTKTVGGKEWLRHFLSNPFGDVTAITNTQHLIKKLIQVQPEWEKNIITNGTIMVMERFYETAIDEIPSSPGITGAFTYSIFSSADFSLVRYSVKHFIDFCKGLEHIIQLLQADNNPIPLQVLIERIKMLLRKPGLQQLIEKTSGKELSKAQLLAIGYYFKRRYKQEALELIEIYSKLDAYYSMAVACKKNDYCFPEFVNDKAPYINVFALYHPLLHTPVAYDVQLNREHNFLFLTGANMGGKSTFIKATGVAVYLAHIGMGVPAKHMQLSLFNGLLSNINVVDNLIQGESYFYNEVQRIKKTIEKINDGHNWLILIDELFKGTNVQDAMRCSSAVIEGLRKMQHSIFVLSTHLYEIGDSLKIHDNIVFKYFETSIVNGQLHFSYQLKDGISNDRLGYLILQREGVVDMLQNL
jgi:DNA mismatch repair protein MutS